MRHLRQEQPPDPEDSGHEYGSPDVYVAEDEDLEIEQAEIAFVDWAANCGPDSYEPYRGTFVGDGTYRMYVVITPVEGFYFDGNTLVKVSDDIYDDEDSASVRILSMERERLAVEITLPALHRWSSDIIWIREPTCQEAGLGTRVCEKNDSHTMTCTRTALTGYWWMIMKKRSARRNCFRTMRLPFCAFRL